ncbi:NRDE family protein [Flavobacterium sp. GT2N3]|uniref:NRDE family protein n=1 Tax=unclassified Flavobacterium TaxID=196869 RepID=UPI003AABD75D
MCTVSFVATNDKIIITSNRDEKTIRPSAIPPRNYAVNGKNLIFPKDPKAGGTWFVAKEDGTILVLLNGADEKHEVKLPYRKSRGLIVLDVISSISPKDFWTEIDLQNIEPFTLVLFQNKALFQLRWNGKEKDTKSLDIHQNHVWSSSTLYSSAIRDKRSQWFHAFMDRNSEISESKMHDFHRYTEKGNDENGLVINRNDEMKTLSITQSVVEKNKVAILHYDLVTQQDFFTSFITV